MIIWGISGNSHDAALAVFKKSTKGLSTKVKLELLFASHSERFSGVKNDPHLNEELVEYARQWGEPDEVVWYERPLLKTWRQFRAGQGIRLKENNIEQYLRNYKIYAPIRYVNHHHSHAAAGYYTSEFNDATVICIDSIGEEETFTIWEASGNQLKKRFKQYYPHSIGLWYSAMTQRIGLKPQEDEYILMGMAAYGNPNRLFMDIYNDFISTEGIGCDPETRMKHNLHRGCRWWRPDLTTEQDFFDIAAATQKVYEYILLNILCWASKNTKSKNLVLMGGCALNCSANHLAYRFFDDVWIMPNPGDSGSAIGSVLAHYKQKIEWPGAFLGYNIEGEYPVQEIISELLRNSICGVASGRAEFGPRAFGNRSLLADPRGPDVKDRVNAIKRRQEFRPFAPVVLEEYAADEFDGCYNDYMQFTSTCTNPDLYPAITHADGTSRVQTVGPDGSGIRALLESWHAETGCPMLLNTSLNIKGKPIVNTTEDAQQFEQHYGVRVCS